MDLTACLSRVLLRILLCALIATGLTAAAPTAAARPSECAATIAHHFDSAVSRTAAVEHQDPKPKPAPKKGGTKKPAKPI